MRNNDRNNHCILQQETTDDKGGLLSAKDPRQVVMRQLWKLQETICLWDLRERNLTAEHWLPLMLCAQPTLVHLASLWLLRQVQFNHINKVNCNKFPGVHVDSDLNWSINTAALTRKAQQRLLFLQRLRKMNPTLLTTFYWMVECRNILVRKLYSCQLHIPAKNIESSRKDHGYLSPFHNQHTYRQMCQKGH